MLNSRTTKRIVCGLTALLVLSLSSLQAGATVSIMAASGRPINNTSASPFYITDGKVSVDGGCSITWIVPVPVPYSTSALNYTVGAKFGGTLIYTDACTFQPSGTWLACTSLRSGPKSVSVPANGGTMFVRAYNSGCTSGGNYLAGVYISN
jgi:hypothetical protein